jgi:hypothetical protein
MNPNYLGKDNLLYELRIRGITSGAEIQSLRKLYRSVVARDLPVDVSHLRGLSVGELSERVLNKIHEFQAVVTQSETALPGLVARVRTKILHLRGRLSHIEATGKAGLGFNPARIKELYEQLEVIERIMASAGEPERLVCKAGGEPSSDYVSTALDSVPK